MAVAPTGAIYKALKFDNVSSRTYGVYITGEAVYNAPARDVEMITIPGRNGSFALDNGRFENIEVSYPAGIFADTEADFRAAISDFRNFLCSRKGYVRLQDEYNPDEYRMAVYKSGLEVDPAMLKAGEFTITFDCKPQRWLTSGEEAVEVESGDTLENPTLFEAGPLLEVKGYGTIDINGSEITRASYPIGTIQVYGGASYSNYSPHTCNLDLSQLNTGDIIQINLTTTFGYRRNNYPIEDAAITSVTNASAYASYTRGSVSYIVAMNANFSKGASLSLTATVSVKAKTNSTNRTGTETITIAYDGASSIVVSVSMSTISTLIDPDFDVVIYPIFGNSTKLSTDKSTFIDLDTGEAYYLVGNTPISVNNAVQLPAELPALAPGSNTITYDNTFTSFKITPRWWKV